MPAGSICVISSHVARGSVGNRAAVFALEALGLQVIAVPSIILPWHPGHGIGAHRTPVPDADFAALLDDLSGGPFAGETCAVLSGYLASEAQVAAVAASIGRWRRVRPDLVYLCDPVTGDESGLYVREGIAAAIRDRLVPIADIVTPNRFELAWMTGGAATGNDDLIAMAQSLGTGSVLVTSAFAMMRGSMANLLVRGSEVLMAEHRMLRRVPNGTGDLTAALFLGHVASGAGAAEALQRTTASVHDMLQRTMRRGADELTLSADADVLTRPVSSVSVRRIVTPPLDKPA